jgi:prepilin-type processing-associated H-X9-DG protein
LTTWIRGAADRKMKEQLIANAVIESREGREIAVTGGFTLVELAGIILVVTSLAILGLPTLVRASQKTKLAACQANLRQLGFALQAYTDANQGLLPGPLSPLIRATADPASPDQLCRFITGLKATSNSSVGELVCPAHQPTAPTGRSRADYALNDGRAFPVPPFGRVGAPPLAPIRITDIRKLSSPAEAWAAADADKANVNPTLAGWNGLPYEPVHGKTRNQLFFDWHVDSRP